MNVREIKNRMRSLTRDFDGAIFRETDLVMFMDEAIDRMKQVIPELRTMKYVRASEEVPKLLPARYHHLISIYGASRCFSQDERHYQSSTLMNEFETKLMEFQMLIESGEEVIVDEEGNPIIIDSPMDYVRNTYYFGRNFKNEEVK